MEDGLEQEFNSLDAQREAGENFIAAQKANGWQCLPDRYDDGGWSGATMDRPALKRLLLDVKQNKIDIIVIYKIDRLSRDVVDSMHLQAFFTKHKVQLAIITQSFDTTTTIGRHILRETMSLAQLEREMTSDRIRDKIAASKKRGKFCGGVPMMGYGAEPISKKLYIIPEEATVIKAIFNKYLALSSVKAVTLGN